MGDLSKNFSRDEFRCKCAECEQVGPPMELVEILQDVRDHFGRAVAVHSGHRCAAYNKRVGGAPRSKHLTGDAADITVAGHTPDQVQDYLLAKYPGRYGIGRYNTFTHVDVRPGPARWDNRR